MSEQRDPAIPAMADDFDALGNGVGAMTVMQFFRLDNGTLGRDGRNPLEDRKSVIGRSQENPVFHFRIPDHVKRSA